jgi:hypothetical protein
MLFTSMDASEIYKRTLDRFMPLKRGEKVYMDGQYWFLLGAFFGKNKLLEVKEVETEVFREKGRWGAYVVDSGNTLKEMAKERGMPLAVVRMPLFSSQGALFYNRYADNRRRVRGVIEDIKEFNSTLRSRFNLPEDKTGYQKMSENLKEYMIAER